MNYSLLQPRWFLEKIERFHFENPATRFQWWYFDLLLKDGTILIVAFVPQQWWPSVITPDVSKSALFITLRHPSGQIQKWVQNYPASALKLSPNRVAVENIFSIEKKGRVYYVSIKIEGVSGHIQVRAEVAPFAASPFGILPLWLLRMFSQKRSPLSYVSLVPRDRAHVQLEGENFKLDQEALGYHEQGRFDGTPHEFQREGWIWFHIFGKDWGIFGAENTFMYITDGESVIQHTFPMRSETYTILEKKYLQNDNRILQSATLHFKTPEISLSIVFEPSNEDNLTYWPSSEGQELWSIRYATAQVRIEHKGKVETFSAPAILETCKCK
jgi:hypothetical protein